MSWAWQCSVVILYGIAQTWSPTTINDVRLHLLVAEWKWSFAEPFLLFFVFDKWIRIAKGHCYLWQSLCCFLCSLSSWTKNKSRFPSWKLHQNICMTVQTIWSKYVLKSKFSRRINTVMKANIIKENCINVSLTKNIVLKALEMTTKNIIRKIYVYLGSPHNIWVSPLWVWAVTFSNRKSFFAGA